MKRIQSNIWEWIIRTCLIITMMIPLGLSSLVSYSAQATQIFNSLPVKFNPTAPKFRLPFSPAQGNVCVNQGTSAGSPSPNPSGHNTGTCEASARHPICNDCSPKADRFALDFHLPEGVPVLAAADAKRVAFSACDVSCEKNFKNPALGWTITLEHADGSKTIYAHLRDRPLYQVGATNISQGTVIGYVGQTGYTTGPVLHFEYRASTRTQWYWASFEDCDGCIPDVGHTYLSSNTLVEATPPAPTEIHVGVVVQATDNQSGLHYLNARSEPAVTDNTLRAQISWGALGYVVDGPITGTNKGTWWKVQWIEGSIEPNQFYNGGTVNQPYWSAEKYLTRMIEPPFTDVTIANHFYNGIVITKKAGLFAGFSDGMFQPDTAIKNREVALVITKWLLGRVPKASDINEKFISGISEIGNLDDPFDIAIEYLARRKILDDIPDFSPTQKSSRAYIISMVMNVLHSSPIYQSIKEHIKTCPYEFEDVSRSEHPYADVIYQACGLGLIGGRINEAGNRQFMPDEDTSRGAAAIIISRAYVTIVDPPVLDTSKPNEPGLRLNSESVYNSNELPYVFDFVASSELLALRYTNQFKVYAPQQTTVIPLGIEQSITPIAYQASLEHLYSNGRLNWSASEFEAVPIGQFPAGTLIASENAVSGNFTSYYVPGDIALPRAYALTPRPIGVFASSAMITLREGGNPVMAMWETAPTLGVFGDYLRGAVPYTVLDEAQLGDGLSGYGLLILPSFARAAYDEIIALLEANGGLAAIHDFVQQGGTLYAQGTGLLLAQAAGVLPANTVDAQAVIVLRDEDAFSNRGVLDIAQPDSPLAYSWLTNTLYLLDDPVLYPDEEGVVEVVAVLTNTTAAEPLPAVIRAGYGAGQVLGVAGHPTDALRRSQVPLFMNALLLALSGEAEFYGDAIQTWNPAYDPHEFPAYETVPVSVTLHVKNRWDKPQYEAVVVERVSRGYDVLTDTISPAPDTVQILEDGSTVITWTLGTLPPNAHLVLSYRANTRPETLGAGRDTFSTGTLAYKELPAGVETVFLPDMGTARLMAHRPFVLTARMAANLKGYLSLEGDRHYRLPADGLYLDLAVVLENKEETVAPNTRATLWALLLAPMVDVENQHVILNANDGETIWVKHEPFLWGTKYPLWAGATSPTQTVTLETWRALPEAERAYCTFTSTHGIHTDPPAGPGLLTEDYGSFITIPSGYEDAITVTAEHELLLPCYPLTWDLGTFPAYWYEEPALRWGVHSRELFEREVVAHGTPREGVVVLPYDAASVYVMAGAHPIPYREYLEHEVAYTPQPPTPVGLTYQDVWAREHTLEFNAVFYDFWKWDSCATCDGSAWSEQHAGFAVTYELVADLDNDGEYETFVREIPTRQARTLLRMLGKTYSDTFGDHGWTIPADQNILDLPVFRGLGVRIRPLTGEWATSYQSIGPGQSTLVDVIDTAAYMHLLFQQEIPQGSWAAFLVDALIENYPGVNKEAATKIHDGGRLVYRQMYAGPNNFEITDAHPHVPESLATNGALRKRSGPQVVSIYSPTIVSQIDVTDLYDPRSFAKAYDPYIKSWGYGDLVWTTYGGGREGKTLFSTVGWTGDRLRLRVALDQNLGFTLTGLDVQPQPFPWMTITKLYTDTDTAPEPIQPELAFLNRSEVPDAWRGVWYFDVEIGDVPDEYRGQVIEIPIHVVADNLPTDKPYGEIPPLRIALRAPGDPEPQYVSAPAGGAVLTDTLPANVTLDAAAWIADPAALQDLWAAIDLDAGDPLSNTARILFQALVAEGRALPIAWTQTDNVVTFELPDAWQHFPAAQGNLSLVTLVTLTRARHGANVVNEGATLCYTDPFGVPWCESTPPVTVYAHGAAPWVEYTCDGGWVPSSLAGTPRVFAHGGACWIPGDAPSEVEMTITGYNDGDAVARTITLTVQIPEGVTVTVLPPNTELIGRDLVWYLGDLAPGGWLAARAVFRVEPDDGVYTANAAQMMGIHHTDGVFTDDYSKTLIQGQMGDAFWFNLYVAPRLARIYLPVVLRAYDTRPDLVITAVTVDPAHPDALQVQIVNQGRSAALDFWVDAFLNPTAPPAVNQTCIELGCVYQAVWYVDELPAGASLTLTPDDAYYEPTWSQWPQPAYPSGTHTLWGYVDSWGSPNPWGGVLETAEDNNRFGPVTFTVDGEATTLTPLRALPPRPVQP